MPSVSLYVDSCVWIAWLPWRVSHTITKDSRDEVAAFDALFRRVVSLYPRAEFLCSAGVLRELHGRHRDDFDSLAQQFSRNVQIPLTRYDGSYAADGSILHGGEFGGALRLLLNLDGHDHEARLREAAERLPPGQRLNVRTERSREFDIEHLEAAMEAGADLFVTLDRKTILNRLRRALPQKSGAIKHAADIAVLPTEAASRLDAILARSA
jgi:hypothetical protein